MHWRREFFILGYLLATLLFGQVAPGESRQSSYLTYLFRLDFKQTERIIERGLEEVDESYFKNLVYEYPTDSLFRFDLPYGNYLKTVAVQNSLEYELITISNVEIRVLNNATDLNLVLYNLEGKEINNPNMSLGAKKLKFDNKTNSYRIKRSNSKGILTVTYDGATSYFGLDREIESSKIKRAFNSVAYSFPLKIITVPTALVVKSPVDLYKSIKHKRPKGIFYYIQKPFSDIIQTIRWGDPQGFIRPIACLLDDDNCKRNRDYSGFIAINQPKYRLGDTVKVKAYILNHKNKLVNKDIEVWVGSGWWLNKKKATKIGVSSPYNPGFYSTNFVLNDSLKLKLDSDVKIHFVKNGESILNESFDYEDYELNKASFELRLAKSKIHRGDSLTAYVKGTDANGLNLLDATVGISVYPVIINELTSDTLYLKNILWSNSKRLSPSGETEISIPASVFSASDIEYDLVAEFKTADFEVHKEVERFQYLLPKIETEYNLKGDSIYLNVSSGDSVISENALVVGFDMNFRVVESSRVQLPSKFKLNPLISKYVIKSESVTDTVDVSAESSLVDVFANRDSDSLRIGLTNPRKLNVRYYVYRKSSEIQRGSSEQLDLKIKTTTKNDYFLSIQYVWAGKAYDRNYKFSLETTNLQIKSNMPTLIYPGKNQDINVSVTDYKGKPVEGADITAFGVTSQFKNYSPPKMPAFEKTYPDRKLINNFELKNNVLDKRTEKTNLNWQIWNAKMTLDSIGYYQFIYPKNGFYNESFEVSDSVTQFAPYVVKDGALLPIHIIYLDEVPIYFSMAQHEQQYSFAVRKGYHHLKIRTANYEVELDSFNIRHGLKTMISIDIRGAKDRIDVSTKTPEITEGEKRLVKKYMGRIQRLGYKTYVRQDSSVFWNSRNRQSVLIGPIQPFSYASYVVQDSYEIDFKFEGGFRYEFSNNLIKMKSDELKYLRFHLGESAPHLNETVFRETDIKNFIQQVENGRQARYEYDEYPMETSEGNGTMALWNPYPKELSPKNYLIFKKSDPSFIRVYGGSTPIFRDLEVGEYHTYVLMGNNNFIEKRNVTVRADATLYLRLDSIAIQQSDSVSQYFNEIFRDLAIPVYYEGKSLQDFNNLKSIYNLTRRGSLSQNGNVVSGTVTDASGEGLPGVNVVIKGTTIGVTTDLDGRYKISVPRNAILVFSSVGMTTNEVSVGSRSYIDLGMTYDVTRLEEVIVIGYGTTLKSSLTGSVATVSASGFAGALQGKVAGVMVSGASGASPSIRIRGMSSISALSTPLFVIDGVLYDGKELDLTPDDIESMEVLKGDQATALYGSRAVNGVVIIGLRNDSKAKKMGGAQVMSLSSFPDITQANPLRRNFSDYAFWQPTLTTDQNGRATFHVTFPDDITSWKTYFLAAKGNTKTGQSEKEVKSFKPVMGTLSVPRFLVKGDSAQIIGRALNYTTDTLKLETSFEINGKLIQNQVIVPKAHMDSLMIPASTLDTLELTYRIRAEDGYEDGEIRKLAIYKKGIIETKGIFKVLDKPQIYELLADSLMGNVIIRAEGNGLPTLLEEIETIRDYPHACNEQTASKIQALLAEQEIREYLDEPFKHDDQIKRHIKRLINSSNNKGLWGWWAEGSTINWISNHVLRALLSAKEKGYDVPLKEDFIINELVAQLEDSKKNKIETVDLLRLLDAKIDYFSTLENMDVKSLDLEDQFKLIRLKQQLNLNNYTLDSLWTNQKETMLGGIYWESNDLWVYRNSNLLTLLALEILKNEDGYSEEKQGIVNYLLGERRDGYWRNTYEGIRIVESILPEILQTSQDYTPSSLRISDDFQRSIDKFPFEEKAVLSDGIQFEKEGSGPVYLTVFQSNFNEDPLRVESDFVVDTYLEAGHNNLKKGVLVTMKVRLEVKKDAEFVMLEIPIPAGCSYGDKVKAKWPAVHREYYRDRVAIFFEVLKAGTYEFEIPLMPRYSGSYTLNPAKAELMYFPTIYGREGSKRIVIE